MSCGVSASEMASTCVTRRFWDERQADDQDQSEHELKAHGELRVVSVVVAERTRRYEPVSVRSWVP